MKVVAIIQARMGSTRLPGKIFMDVMGKPLFWHFVERIKRAKNVDRMIIATTNKKEDDCICEFASSGNSLKSCILYKGLVFNISEYSNVSDKSISKNCYHRFSFTS